MTAGDRGAAALVQAVFGHAARRHIIFNKLLSRPAETAQSGSRRAISEVPAGESLSTSRCRRLTWMNPLRWK